MRKSDPFRAALPAEPWRPSPKPRTTGHGPIRPAHARRQRTFRYADRAEERVRPSGPRGAATDDRLLSYIGH